MPDVRLCCVEDDPDVAETLTLLLESHEGWHVTHLPTIAAARERLRGDRFDVVILDHQLPDGSGIDLIPVVRENAPETLIMVLTGSGDASLALQSYSLGALDYGVKGPELVRELVPRVEELLARGQDAARSARVSAVAAVARRPAARARGGSRVTREDLRAIVRGNVIGAALFDAHGAPLELDLPERFDARALSLLCAHVLTDVGAAALATRSTARSVVVAATTETALVVLGTSQGGFAAVCFPPDAPVHEAVAHACSWIAGLASGDQ